MKYVPKELSETADASRGQQSLQDRLKFLFSVVVVLGGLYLFLGLIAELAATKINEANETEWFSAWVIGDAESDNVRFQAAKKTFERLTTDSEVRPLRYRLSVLQMEEPNAFAVPGGNVGVTTGLLENLPEEISVAMVLGHELGHHAHRHTLAGLGRTLLQQILTSILFSQAGVSAFGGLQALMQRQYSQAAEYEADEFGLRLVHRVYGTTEGALNFYLSVQHHDIGSTRAGSWFRTHPLTEDRIRRLEKVQAELKR